VDQIDFVLLAVKDEVERLGLPEPSRRVEASIQTQLQRTRLLDTLRTADAEGRVNQGNGIPQADPPLTIADRDFFQHLKANPRAGLYASPPVVSRLSGKQSMVLARRLNRPDGGFAGIIYATVPLEQLGQLLSSVDVGPRGSISIRGADLALLVRHPAYPGLEKLIGDTRVEGDYLEAVQSGRTVSQFSTHSRIDGEIRTYTFRRVISPTFFILVSLAQRDYLGPWRREAAFVALAVAGLIALSVAMAWWARLTWRRQLDAQKERDHLIQQLTQALGDVNKLEGMLPICGHCKKIRDDQGYWSQVETYISAHTEATFTHGICPDCAEVFRSEMQVRRTPKENEGAP
jgi:hypothetical protein